MLQQIFTWPGEHVDPGPYELSDRPIVCNGKRCGDTATHSMTHDDNVLHMQARHRELDGCRGAMVSAGGLAWRNERRDIPDDEVLARCRGEYRRRINTTVGAGDDHRAGMLRRGKRAKSGGLSTVAAATEAFVALP